MLDAAWFDDDDAAGEVVHVVHCDESVDEIEHRIGIVADSSEDEHAGVAARRVAA